MDSMILERLAVIEAVVLRLEARLFGNGQPGEVADLARRVGRLEAWLWRLAGAGAILLAALELTLRPLGRLFAP
jgi:hypothetical protein